MKDQASLNRPATDGVADKKIASAGGNPPSSPDSAPLAAAQSQLAAKLHAESIVVDGHVHITERVFHEGIARRAERGDPRPLSGGRLQPLQLHD